MTDKKIELALAQCKPGKECSTQFIAFDPKNGIIPKCHYVQTGTLEKTNAIVIGLNPGRSQNSVEQYMIINAKGGINAGREARYDAWKNEYSQTFHGYAYYNPVVLLLKKIGIEGDILWTDIFKCEKQKDPKFHKDTIRRCTKKHLVEELKSFALDRKNYHIFVLGGQAQKYFQSYVIDYAKICSDMTLCNILKNSIMIGLPHPSKTNTHVNNFLSYLQPKKVVKIKTLLKRRAKGKLIILA